MTLPASPTPQQRATNTKLDICKCVLPFRVRICLGEGAFPVTQLLSLLPTVLSSRCGFISVYWARDHRAACPQASRPFYIVHRAQRNRFVCFDVIIIFFFTKPSHFWSWILTPWLRFCSVTVFFKAVGLWITSTGVSREIEALSQTSEQSTPLYLYLKI